jgi:hypothetical protein
MIELRPYQSDGLIMPPANPIKKLAKENGEEYYFTGKPCKNGHIAKRYVKWNTCTECVLMHGRNNGKRYRLRVRTWGLNKIYGITREQYDELLIKQNGVCAICQQIEKSLSNHQTKKELAVDHCKITKKVRGLLCQKCNQGIGQFQHNSEILKRAALYCEAAI